MRTLNIKTFTWIVLGLCSLLTGAGCRPGTPAEGSGAADESPSNAALKPCEYWEAQFLSGAKVGYAHTKRSKTVEDGRELVSLSTYTRLTVKRDDEPVTQDMVYTSIEKPDGTVVRFETSMSGGGGSAVTKGRVDGHQLIVENTTSGRTNTHTLTWDPAGGGFFAVEQSLERTPMKPGERRTVRTLVPFFMQMADVHLEAFDDEDTPMLSDRSNLLKIKKTIVLQGDQQLVSWIWCDGAGQTLKSQLIGGLGGESYRTTKEDAVSQLDDVDFDLFRMTTVKVDRPLTDPHRKRRIVYRVRLEDNDPNEAFTAGSGQTKQRIDDNTVQITVRARGLNDQGDAAAARKQPGKADRLPNNYIQSDDERVVALARKVAPDEKDAARLAAALEQFVGKYVERKDFSRALATAAEVAESGQGDCTEHAVLLAALCRARGLPARVAIGLVGSERDGGFAYHMWNEVWIGDRWIPLDATLRMGGIGAAHLKISHTNLHDVSPYAAFLPVYQLLGSLKIEILEME